MLFYLIHNTYQPTSGSDFIYDIEFSVKLGGSYPEATEIKKLDNKMVIQMKTTPNIGGDFMDNQNFVCEGIMLTLSF